MIHLIVILLLILSTLSAIAFLIISMAMDEGYFLIPFAVAIVVSITLMYILIDTHTGELEARLYTETFEIIETPEVDGRRAQIFFHNGKLKTVQDIFGSTVVNNEEKAVQYNYKAGYKNGIWTDRAWYSLVDK